MGYPRCSPAVRHTRLRLSAWTSLVVFAALLAAWAIAALVGDGASGLVHSRGYHLQVEGVVGAKSSRHLSAYPDDPLIDKPYATSANRWLVFIHVFLIAYMLLGLNTVCDVYFCGALDEMVNRWHVKPDVAGATFMAAGGSAPELFTSLIGTLVTQDDVGFGTIVGSAVFNVLFVIGLCAFVSNGEIQLTWWPLFRDCASYIVGLSLFAWAASDEIINIWEALLLLAAYVVYCTLMYNNARLEAVADMEFWRAKKQVEAGHVQFVAVKPQQMADAQDAARPPCAWGELDEAVGRPEPGGDCTARHTCKLGKSTDCCVVEVLGNSSAQGTQRCPNELEVGRTDNPERRWSNVSAQPRPPPLLEVGGQDAPARRLSNFSATMDARLAPTMNGRLRNFMLRHQNSKASHDERMQSLTKSLSGEQHPGISSGSTSMTSVPLPASTDSEEEGKDINLMVWPEDRKGFILWCLALPVYVPLHYTMPRSPDWFLLTFALSLVWIGFYSFFMVWWIEILSEVLRIPTIVAGFTILAAGTSIPDAASSMAVARMGEGDMAISSSVGSNIFDILVGLPIPWIIKLAVDLMVGRTSQVRIRSPYLTFHVLLLLLMVFAVVVSIHMMRWKLNRMLGVCMALLYSAFLCIAITVEMARPSWLKI